ncbi:MAG: exo-alpha-sialidase [Actinomycetales bacterium]|nr:exo-alpha-sialidase [Actinomycetales bacterium]
MSGQAWAHVHNLAYDGRTLLLGTHEGLYAQPPGAQPELLSETPFDVMALTRGDEQWLASGHPGAGEDLPADLGLRTSETGQTWTTMSLLGQVDFHRLSAAGSTIVGLSAHDGALLRSDDDGSNWATIDNPGIYDVAVDPHDPDVILATTESGPIWSRDGGNNWTPVEGAPLIALLAFTSAGVYGVAPDGTIHQSSDAGASWQQRGSVSGQPAAMTADGERVAVLVGGRVMESTDSGATFQIRLTGIDGH